MTDIAIRVDHLSKLYPAVAPRARHLGRAQSRAGDSLRSQRHDTPSTSDRRSALRTRLRDALVAAFRRQETGVRKQDSLTPTPGP